MTPVGRNADPALRSLAALLERCEVALAGIDGGGLEDLLGLAVIGREKNSSPAEREEADDGPDPPGDGENEILRIPAGRWLHWGHAWVSEDVLERRKEIAPKLRDFAADGDLTIVPNIDGAVDMTVAFAEVAGFVDQVMASGIAPEKAAIGVDQAGLGLILQALGALGIDTTPEAGIVVGIPQGWKLQNAIKTVEVKLGGRTFIHGGTRLMAWSVGNAKVEPRGNAILITKQASGFAKIDPLMALFDAAALMAMNPVAAISVYDKEHRGFLVL